MAIHIIIDGYNLIRNSAELSVLDRLDIQGGREALIDMLAAYKKIKPHKITVVFDGADVAGQPHSRSRVKGISVKYSRSGEPADHVIIRMAAHERERALVVSSDNEILRAASACRAATITSPAFAEKLYLATVDGSATAEAENGPSRRSSSTKKKGPQRRLPRRQRRNREKTKRL